MRIQLRLLDPQEPTEINLVVTKGDLNKMASKGIMAKTLVATLSRMGIFAITAGRVNVRLEVIDDPYDVEARVVEDKKEGR
jgi:peroxiredoxin family protein